LPCDDNICEEHVIESNTVKRNQIKCCICGQEFEVKDIEIRSNKLMKELLESDVFLTQEEQRLKKQIRSTIVERINNNAKFIQNKNNLELECYNHFQEIRRQIDLHREESPKILNASILRTIERVNLDMIDQFRLSEAKYLQIITQLEIPFLKSLDEEIENLSEKFRDPNISLDQIKKIQSEQVEHLRKIENKQRELNKIMDQIKTIKFEGELFNSHILTGAQQIDLIKLCGFSILDKWTLLYRGSRDGFHSECFHLKCDRNSPTLTILKAESSGFIFGGYTEAPWSQPRKGRYKSDKKAFIFSLTNGDNNPLKMQPWNDYSIRCKYEFGPTFGFSVPNIGNDILIKGKSGNISNLGYTYKHPQYDNRSEKVKSFLAGSKEFLLEEIEVFLKKITF